MTRPLAGLHPTQFPAGYSLGGPVNLIQSNLVTMSDESDDRESLAPWDSSLVISSVVEDYRTGIKPQDVIEAIYERIEAYQKVQSSVWIYIEPKESVINAARDLSNRWPDENDRPPLWGIPFSVKDNFDVAGVLTTVGCPALAYTPDISAASYQKCIDAGGLFIGKTNMEQLATGLTGCRSPYGTLHSTFSKTHIVGGSSSGSAVSVSEGLVSFSLGSDTAGSIRVPALFNGLVGFKPTKGTISARGVYPACLHHDSVSILALNSEDVGTVWQICKGFDKGDIFAKLPPKHPTHATTASTPAFKFCIPPDDVLKFCSTAYYKHFTLTVKALERVGGKCSVLNWVPFAAANDLLYNGAFVLERLTILPDGWYEENKQVLHPVTRWVFENAISRQSTAVDLFRDLHKQAELKRRIEELLVSDHSEPGQPVVLVVPTAPSHPTIEEVTRDPLKTNEQLGMFSHFANVLDLTGIALPCGTYAATGEGHSRLPFGVTILAGSGLDDMLLRLGKQLEDILIDVGQED